MDKVSIYPHKKCILFYRAPPCLADPSKGCVDGRVERACATISITHSTGCHWDSISFWFSASFHWIFHTWPTLQLQNTIKYLTVKEAQDFSALNLDWTQRCENWHLTELARVPWQFPEMMLKLLGICNPLIWNGSFLTSQRIWVYMSHDPVKASSHSTFNWWSKGKLPHRWIQTRQPDTRRDSAGAEKHSFWSFGPWRHTAQVMFHCHLAKQKVGC